MIRVKHRSIATPADNLWEYDPARRAIDVVLREKRAAFTVPVCAVDRPRAGSFAITREEGGAWKIQPSAFGWGRNGLGREALLCRDSAIHMTLDDRTSLLLTDVPAQVELELLELL